MIVRKSTYFLFLSIAAITAASFLPAAAGDKLTRTPRDYEGPFYPIVRQADEDNDLLHVAGRRHPARGDKLHLSGRVVDVNGRPLAGAYVEIWQTDPEGRYRDKRDTSPGERDPDFQYWGLAMTGPDGSFSFATLVPGAYEPRPAHIHFKVWVARKLQLTSQIYFKAADAQMQEKLGGYPDRPLQTVDLHKQAPGEYEAFFQIVL